MGMMVNRRRVCGGKKGLLPSGYKQLEYIENTSNAYIDTGVDVSTLDYDIIMYGGTNKTFGFIHNNQVNGTWICVYKANDLGTSIDYYNRNYNSRKVTTLFQDSVLKYSMKEGLYIDERVVSSFTCTRGTDRLENKTLFVGGLYDFLVNTLSLTNQIGTLKRVEIIRNNTIVRNFIPCINPNNVVGMYDTVNGVFYSSPNGTAFVAGPEV